MTLPSDQDTLLLIEDAAHPGQFLLLGGVQQWQMSLAGETRRSDSLESGPWRTLLPGTGGRALSLSIAGIFEASAAESQLLQATLSANAVAMRLTMSGGTLQGPFVPAKYDRSHDEGTAITVRLTLESAGEISYGA